MNFLCLDLKSKTIYSKSIAVDLLIIPSNNHLIYYEVLNHFFFMVAFFAVSFFLTQFYKCFSKNTSANGFSQNLQGIIFISSSFSSASSSSFSSSSTLSFFMALIAALKSSDAAFQLSLVFSKPFPLPLPYFFSLAFTCLARTACSFVTNLFASELNSFLFDIKTNLQALACFSRAFLLNFLPHPSGHSTRSFSPCCKDY